MQQKNISLVKDFLNLKNQDKFEKFKYLQSIYASYKDDPEMVIFPLIYSISFNNSFIKKNMKQDFKSIIEEKLKIENNIQYDNINKEFLKYFNRLLNEDNNKSMETFRYFSVLKNIIEECERRLVVNDLDKKSKGQLDGINLNNKNGTSIHSNSSEVFKSIISENSNNNMNTIKIEDNSQKKDNNSKVVNKPPDAKSYFFLSLKIMLLNELCSTLSSNFDNLKINKDLLDKHNQSLISHYDNKLSLNKLSSTILLLQNPNIINLRRKITEVLIFEIMEKYPNIFQFSSEYSPNISKLNELSKLMSKALEESEEKKKEKN